MKVVKSNGPSDVARALLALTSRVLLVMIVAGYVTEIPGIKSYLEGLAPPNVTYYLVYSLVILGGLAGLVAWLSAVYFAFHDGGQRGVPRVLLLTVLVIGNAAAAFLYYWFYVHWRRMEPMDQARARAH